MKVYMSMLCSPGLIYNTLDLRGLSHMSNHVKATNVIYEVAKRTVRAFAQNKRTEHHTRNMTMLWTHVLDAIIHLDLYA